MGRKHQKQPGSKAAAVLVVIFTPPAIRQYLSFKKYILSRADTSHWATFSAQEESWIILEKKTFMEITNNGQHSETEEDKTA